MTKLRLVCAAAALAAVASGTAYAEATANMGIMSNYIFRGIYQSDATAFAGLDINTDSGFYMGTWGANVADGLEYDIYLGYERGNDNLNWYVGATGYFYTDQFDGTYQEVNLGFTYGFMTIDYATGDYAVNDASAPVNPPGNPGSWFGAEQSYMYLGATFAPERGPYYFLGRIDYANIPRTDQYRLYQMQNNLAFNTGRWPNSGKSGYWVELGKSFEIMEDLDISVAALYSFDVVTPPSTNPPSIQLGPSSAADSEYALVVTLTKTIHIGE